MRNGLKEDGGKINTALDFWVVGGVILTYALVGAMALLNPHLIVPVVSLVGISWAIGVLALSKVQESLNDDHKRLFSQG